MCCRYKRTLHACLLHNDLSLMPEGDDTVVGSRVIRTSRLSKYDTVPAKN